MTYKKGDIETLSNIPVFVRWYNGRGGECQPMVCTIRMTEFPEKVLLFAPGSMACVDIDKIKSIEKLELKKG